LLQLADLCYNEAMTLLFALPFVVALVFAALTFYQERN
jgi:hypothetical protein